MTALTDIHTQCWLIHAGRFDDAVRYSATRDQGLTREAGLVIQRISHNSPADIEFKLSPESLAEVVPKVIDGILQAPSRLRERQLEVKRREQELEVRQREADAEDKKRTQDLELAREQAIQAKKKAEQEIETERLRADVERIKAEVEVRRLEQEIELERAREAVERERQLLVLEQQRLALKQATLELQRQQFRLALDQASEAVDVLYPGASPDARPTLVRTLAESILRLGETEGLSRISVSIAPPSARSSTTEEPL